MDLKVEDMPNGVTKAVLSGRMDIDGARAVDMRFNILAGSKNRLIVDMAGVDFIASMGLRTLMTCARAITSRGGRVALAGAQPNVAKVLDTSGIKYVATLAPSVDDAAAAIVADA